MTIVRHMANHHLMFLDDAETTHTIRTFERMLDHYSEATGCQLPVENSYKTLLRMLGATADLENSSKRLMDKLFHTLIQYPPTFIEGARELLDELTQQRVQIGLCSNTNLVKGQHLDYVLELYNLFGEALVFSDQMEVCKPDSKIFQDIRTRLEKFGCTEFLHVGDNPHTDGASHLVGLTPIIVNQPNTPSIGDLLTHLKEKEWLQHKPSEQLADTQ